MARLLLAFALMMVAGLIKHNLLALPFAAFILLWLESRQRAIVVAIFSAAFTGIAALILYRNFGAGFFEALTMPREWSLIRPLTRIGRLQFVLPVLLFWGYWLTQTRQEQTKRLSILLVVTAMASNFIALTGAGVANNAQFELVFGTGLCLAWIVTDLQGRFERIGPLTIDMGLALLIVMIGRFILWPFFDPYLLPLSSAYRAEIAARVAVMDGEIDRVRAIEGPVNCSVRSVCYLAGKDFVFDDFAIEQRIRTGHAMREAVHDDIKKRGIRFVTNPEETRWHLP
jgi:hypothetical protein